MTAMKVLVLQVTGLHLGFLGCYGNTWIDTPAVDRLASGSVVFDQHHADCLGLRTAWTGRHGAGEEPDTLELCRQAGVAVAALDAAALPAEPDASALETTLDAALAAVESLWPHERWLCWVDLPGLQPPWDVPASFPARYLADEAGDAEDAEEEEDEPAEPLEPLLNPRVGEFDREDLILWERLRCSYAGVVSYLDAGLGLLLDELRARDWLDNILLLLTADRGLALGEHGVVGECRPWLHDEVVHVPLIVRQPAGAAASRRTSALTQPLDLAATLLDCFGITASRDGKSLLPLLRGEVEAVREQAVSHWACGGEEEWSLRTGAWAFLLPREPSPRERQLYAKPEDRWELNNVIQHHLETAEELEKRLREASVISDQ
jgi:arylsulfatase A-like enzyme